MAFLNSKFEVIGLREKQCNDNYCMVEKHN